MSYGVLVACDFVRFLRSGRVDVYKCVEDAFIIFSSTSWAVLKVVQCRTLLHLRASFYLHPLAAGPFSRGFPSSFPIGGHLSTRRSCESTTCHDNCNPCYLQNCISSSTTCYCWVSFSKRVIKISMLSKQFYGSTSVIDYTAYPMRNVFDENAPGSHHPDCGRLLVK